MAFGRNWRPQTKTPCLTAKTIGFQRHSTIREGVETNGVFITNGLDPKAVFNKRFCEGARYRK